MYLIMLRRNLGNQHKVKTRMITKSIWQQGKGIKFIRHCCYRDRIVIILVTHDVPHLYDLLATLVDLLGLVDGGARLVVVIFPLASLTTLLLLLGLLVILGTLDL